MSPPYPRRTPISPVPRAQAAREPLLLLHLRCIGLALRRIVAPPRDHALTWSTVNSPHVRVRLHRAHFFLSSLCQITRRCSVENVRLASFRSKRVQRRPLRMSRRRSRVALLSVSPCTVNR